MASIKHFICYNSIISHIQSWEILWDILYYALNSFFISSPFLTDEENKKLYGKCNNPNGHGHNYVGMYK